MLDEQKTMFSKNLMAWIFKDSWFLDTFLWQDFSSLSTLMLNTDISQKFSVIFSCHTYLTLPLPSICCHINMHLAWLYISYSFFTLHDLWMCTFYVSFSLHDLFRKSYLNLLVHKSLLFELWRARMEETVTITTKSSSIYGYIKLQKSEIYE